MTRFSGTSPIFRYSKQHNVSETGYFFPKLYVLQNAGRWTKTKSPIIRIFRNIFVIMVDDILLPTEENKSGN
jgi:hypothetical protein